MLGASGIHSEGLDFVFLTLTHKGFANFLNRIEYERVTDQQTRHLSLYNDYRMLLSKLLTQHSGIMRNIYYCEENIDIIIGKFHSEFFRFYRPNKVLHNEHHIN
ncbi:hypothetical protein YDYSG_47470 [Paenibacillus tyrfis]|nr:hypothetical protein YDYSG_47470 [Paenibacillus tyrfis]